MNKDNNKVNILIVDDEASVRGSLSRWFEEFDYNVGSAADAAEALDKFRPGKWDIVFLDIRLPGMDGTELHHKMKEIDPDITTIMITAYASVDTAIKTLKDGAYDYITKPIDPDYLSHLVSNIIEKKQLFSENQKLKKRLNALCKFDKFLGDTPQIKKLLDLVKTVAPTDTSVMIRGESGTGKELLAQLIHSLSPRRYSPIVTINCAGLTPGLAESEFFGHEKGAFTGAIYRRKGKLEIAHQGTVFLDEIGCIDSKTQMDLLRAIETRQFTRVGGNEIVNVDFRLICATNLDMEKAVEQGTFREDLYYRLNVFSLFVPPLREHRADIPVIANGLLKKLSTSMNKNITGFSNGAMDLLTNRDWSGNVRELRNSIERAVVVCNKQVISSDCFVLDNISDISPQDQSLMTIEKRHIQNVLDKTGGNITHAAETLQIDRTTLYHKIEKYGLCR